LYVPTAALGCGNDALRSELGIGRLADCRAYEMVSPPYKEGYPLYAFSYSADGEKAIMGGLANLVGAPGAGESPLEGDLYVSSRTAMGWQLSPLNAPLSKFVGQLPLAYEANSGETLWNQHTPAQSAFTRDLYARSATGVYRLIGPLGVPFKGEETEEANYILTINLHFDRPIAATKDYGHVVLRALNLEDHWPFDETSGSESLYEYSGTDNSKPILIGVKGPKGSRELVSRCGAELGSGQVGSAYNAISSDGEAIFFTALPEASCGAPGPATAEVYARLHGSLVSPSPAETVDVSASECGVGCGEASGKNFEGASENGRIVFFTSTQKLTNEAIDGTASGNADNKSGCANTAQGEGGCNLYVYNFDAPGAECQEARRCLKLVAGGEVLGVAAVAENGQRVYFVKRSPLGQPDLYVYDVNTGQTALVAALSFTGEEEGTIWAREFRHPVEVSGEDGRYLLFASATPELTTDDKSSVVQLFEYDALSGELVRVTKGEDGYNGNGNGAAVGVNPESVIGIAENLGHIVDFKSGTNRLNMSQDGKTVVFRTRGGLSPYATSAENCASIYEFHTVGALSEGSVHLLSDGVDVQPRQGSGCGAGFEGIDGSGANVLFSTADPLLPSDVDGVQRDVYDARVEGEFSSPRTGLCENEACGVPAGSAISGPLVPGSVTQGPEPMSLSPSSFAPAKKAGTAGGSKKKAVSRSGKLARALQVCRTGPKVRRAACERSARRRYGSRVNAKRAELGVVR
jgi:hypothetical protein